MSLFEITGSHISHLNDSDLRTLVAMLCEAELHSRGLPVSGVTAGGDQNAPDGGIDVRVDLSSTTLIDGYIPRPATGFQVKVPDMPRTAILDEMRPKGILRSSIEKLADASGAYVIVSANGSTADIALQERRQGMSDAISALPNSGALFVDFYDRERLATWVRQHPGIVTWVREKIGQPLFGWHPYGNWANPTEPADAEYLFDEKSRIHDSKSKLNGPLTIKDGIQRIRKVLATPRGIVRSVGLSGMERQGWFKPCLTNRSEIMPYLKRLLSIQTWLMTQIHLQER
jgi:hypothetical protein